MSCAFTGEKKKRNREYVSLNEKAHHLCCTFYPTPYPPPPPSKKKSIMTCISISLLNIPS